MYRALVLASTWLGGLAGHQGGDYLAQSDHDARHKQNRTPAGRKALLSHCLSYAATQAVTKAATYRAAGLQVPLTAQLAGVLAEAALHGLIDDGRLLRRFAELRGKLAFYDLASGGVCGRMLMDQAAHQSLQIPLGALVTTMLAVRSRGSEG